MRKPFNRAKKKKININVQAINIVEQSKKNVYPWNSRVHTNPYAYPQEILFEEYSI